MSQHGHEEPHGHQAEDEIQYGKIIKVGVVSLIVFALCTVWAAIIMSKHTKQVQDETGVAEAHAEIVIEPGLLFSMENEAGKVSPAS